MTIFYHSFLHPKNVLAPDYATVGVIFLVWTSDSNNDKKVNKLLETSCEFRFQLDPLSVWLILGFRLLHGASR